MSLKSSFWLRSFSSSRASSYLLHYRMRIIHYRFDLEEEKKKQPTISTEQRHQAEWSLLGCQNIIHGFQFLGLDGDVHLVWLLILKQIHLPPNLTEVKKKRSIIKYQGNDLVPKSTQRGTAPTLTLFGADDLSCVPSTYLQSEHTRHEIQNQGGTCKRY